MNKLVRRVFVTASMLTACERGPQQVPVDIIYAMKEHGIAVGSRISSVQLGCTDGQRRRIADPVAVQVITFATISDCLDCFRHLDGLENLAREGRMPENQFVVAYGPAGTHESNLALLNARTKRPICFDTAGVLWRRHDLTSTPFTVVVRKGRVSFLHDLPTDTKGSEESFDRAARATLTQ